MSNAESNSSSHNAYLIENNKSYKNEKNVINDYNFQRFEVSRVYNTETIFVGKINYLK